MTNEENVKKELEEKFSYLKDLVIIKRIGRIFVEVAIDKFDEVLESSVKDLGFNALTTITGMDINDAFVVIYHLHKEGKILLNIKVKISKDNPEVKTVTPYFLSAEMYERELMDLLGIKIKGLGSGNRYPLPDSWPINDYPLRKDWKPKEQNKEAQNA